MKLCIATVVLLGVGIAGIVRADEPPTKDVVFAKVDSHELKLNLFMPTGVENPPLVVFIHGGGWKAGSYKNCRVRWLTRSGYAVASIGYRLTDKATFPAQIHDCKGAVRWLRAHQKDYGFNAEKIGVAGTSAGGHLALLMGASGDDKKLEGEVGGNLDQSSRVQAVVDYYGPSDFVVRSRLQPSKTQPPTSSVHLLLGKSAAEDPEAAKFASPAYYVTKDDAPLLILQGDKDRVVHPRQSRRMHQAYQDAGLDVKLEILKGAKHSGAVFFSRPYRRQVTQFFNKHLKGESPEKASDKPTESKDAG